MKRSAPHVGSGSSIGHRSHSIEHFLCGSASESQQQHAIGVDAIIKKSCDDVLSQLGSNDPLLDIALHLEEVALKDDYFISRKLFPNVDFYSGILYRALGVPTEMFTVMFAIGRMPGWIAQWKEMITAPDTRIGRPRQIYTGPTARPYVPLDKR